VRPSLISSSRLAIAAALGLAALAVFFVLRGAQILGPGEPPLVADEARLMSAEQRDFLASFHGFLAVDHDIDYRVVTAANTGDINRFAVERFEELFANSRSATGRGLLLVVDPAQDLVRLEVSFALEGVFPDAFVAYIENRQMVPFFRTNRIADGILASTELIVDRAQHAADNAGFEDEVWATASGGGGAVAPARIGQGRAPAPAPAPQQAAVPARTPAEALHAYFAAMAARDASPELPFYTPETRAMLRGWTVTPAQMDMLVKTYRRCTAEPVKIGPNGSFAVIRYPVRQRACAPFFFHKSGGGWALDLTMMQRAIRFGRTNAWHFDVAVDHPYRFAFADWRFDAHGFPIGRK